MKTALITARIPLLVSLFVVCLCCSCERPKSASEHNAVKDFVNVPKDKARDVKSKLESAQNKEADEADKLLDADE